MKRLFFLLPILTALLVSCLNNVNEPGDPVIVINESDAVVALPPEGGEFRYVCNVLYGQEDWTWSADSQDEWISEIAFDVDTLGFKADTNRTGSARTASIVIVYGNGTDRVEARLVLTQESEAVYDYEMRFYKATYEVEEYNEEMNRIRIRMSDADYLEQGVLHQGYHYHTFHIYSPKHEDGLEISAAGTYTAGIMYGEKESMTFAPDESYYYYSTEEQECYCAYLSGKLIVDVTLDTLSDNQLLPVWNMIDAVVTASDGRTYHAFWNPSY